MKLIGSISKRFKKIKLEILFWIISQKWYRWIMMNVIPYIRLTTYYALPENPDYDKWGALMNKGYESLQPGDIILAIDKEKLTTKVIGGATAEFGQGEVLFVPSHAALCVSKDGKFEVAEMTHTNFTQSTWSDICYEATRVVILRCVHWDKDYINKQVIPTCKSFKDKKYDVKFHQGADELICSELVYFSDPERRLDVSLDPILGFDPYISPVGLLKAKNCVLVWDSNKG